MTLRKSDRLIVLDIDTSITNITLIVNKRKKIAINQSILRVAHRKFKYSFFSCPPFETSRILYMQDLRNELSFFAFTSRRRVRIVYVSPLENTRQRKNRQARKTGIHNRARRNSHVRNNIFL